MNSNTEPDSLIDELSHAAFNNDISRVDEILATTVNVNLFDEDGTTPLFTATVALNPLIVDKLLKAGANPNLGTDNMVELPIMRVVTHVYRSVEGQSIFDMLISAGANINFQTKLGETALMTAARFGIIKAVRKLIECGANPDLTDNYGKKAIDYAHLGLEEHKCSIIERQHEACIALLDSAKVN